MFQALNILKIIPSNKKKSDTFANLKKSLNESKNFRTKIENNDLLLASLENLRKFQSNRLCITYEDFFNEPDTKEAANFFLENLYGDKNFSIFYKDLDTLLPTMEKLFPEPALRIISKSLELNLITEKLDITLTEKLGVKFTEKQYWKVYRSKELEAYRIQQLELFNEIGSQLIKASRMPLISNLLSVMHTPAKKMGVLNLHLFLEKGFHVFKNMKNAEIFIQTIYEKEMSLLLKK